MKASYQPYTLQFKIPGGTSRGVLHQKETYFITIEDNGKKGVGECGLLKKLSIDDRPDYEEKLQWVCDNIQLGLNALYEAMTEFPSIQFGLEQAFLALENNSDILFPSAFTRGEDGITINGLIWMGDIQFMQQQIEAKVAQGFSCIKLKIGALNFEEEYKIIQQLRTEYPNIEIRVDANGAFEYEEALEKLERLEKLGLHSIEQPIKAGQYEKMAQLCSVTPLPIALDEELIGVFHVEEKENLLRKIKPQYIIIKPSLVGGFRGSQEWIQLAEQHNIKWWITSALESNIGLNAIAQWTYTLQNSMPQGLGTGGLFTNNLPTLLEVRGEKLWMNS